jgi:hypothetical protein
VAEVRLPAPVKATLVDDIDQHADTPGAFEFVNYYKGTPEGRGMARENPAEHPAGMVYVCPCGCGVQGYLAIRSTKPEHPSWVWNGKCHSPTLTPSIHHIGHWHGFLTKGVWRQA